MKYLVIALSLILPSVAWGQTAPPAAPSMDDKLAVCQWAEAQTRALAENLAGQLRAKQAEIDAMKKPAMEKKAEPPKKETK